jgi:hypothetical protein
MDPYKDKQNLNGTNDLESLRRIDGITQKDRTGNETSSEKAGIQHLLTELEEKRLQWFGHVETMDRSRILRGA